MEIDSTVKYLNTYKTEVPKNNGKIGCVFKMRLNEKKSLLCKYIYLQYSNTQKEILFLSTQKYDL